MVFQYIRPGDKTKGDFHFILKKQEMKNLLRQVAAIDVAKDELVVCIGRMLDDFTQKLYASKVFVNSKKGTEALHAWVGKQTLPALDLQYVMEATGVYHEALAYFLDEKGKKVSIVLPNKISNYFRTLDVKTITDKTSSEAIVRFGLERKLDNWKRPRMIYKQLRQLIRERDQVISERTVVKNQLHAEKSEAFSNKHTLAGLAAAIFLTCVPLPL